tara:strand:+ start:122164 stop:123135 length:972 start_codon:yes stop_codon:yes gene_type:complete
VLDPLELVHRIAAWSLCLALVGACTIRDDSTRANQIEGLRILALASEPADLVQGESTTLSALVYDEDERAVSYQWSWCISRGNSDEGYLCNISESELETAWDELDTGIDLPPYDLGTQETAAFEMFFAPEQALGVCEILSRDAAEPDLELFTCLSSLALTIELRVTAGSDQIVAIKDIPILLEGDERNLNPAIGPNFTRTLRGGTELQTTAPFQLEGIYDVVADVDEAQSETFLPQAREGLPPPEPRKESLFLSWFVTVGSTHRKGEQHTAYFDTGSIESLTENTWDMPFEFEDADARLFLVLRDERGGTTWAEHAFTLEDGQ